jgi:hypothetical protein
MEGLLPNYLKIPVSSCRYLVAEPGLEEFGNPEYQGNCPLE